MSPRYTALMASLPPLGRLFEAREPAISRLKLQSRLSLLHPADRHSLDRAIGILSQGLVGDAGAAAVRGDALLLADAQRFFEEVHHPLLRQLVRHRLDLRTTIAALRRRHRGELEPPRDQAWGFGPLLPTIERHWLDPNLGLAGVFPWIGEAQRLLESTDLIGLERLLFGLIWRELDRLALGHNFDFEAVVIYLARWSLVERWSNYDAATAAARFGQLLAAGLGPFRDPLALGLAR